MIGFMREDEAVAFQRGMLLAAGTDEAAMRASWQRAAADVARLPPLSPPNVDARSLTPAAQTAAHQLGADPLFQQLFPGAAEWCSLRIDQLLSIQGYVDTEFVGSLSAPPQSDEAEVLRFCMRANPLDPPLVGSDGQVTFSSHFKSNLTNVGLSIEEVTPTTYKVSALIVSRPNYMYAAEVQGKYILANGYHRALALKRAGHDRVPCLVRHFADHSQAFLPGAGYFDAAHLSVPRPPLVVDFEDRPAGIVDFEMGGRAHIMRVGLMVSQFEAPR